MNAQRQKVYDELKNNVKLRPQINPVVGVPQSNMIQQSTSSPFILSSGPVTGSNTPAPVLPNQINSSTFPTLEAMTPAQKIVANAHNVSFGFYVPQDSQINPILPVLPRYN